MSKKVLILSASPRKGGNSDLLCDQFLLGAKEAGNEVEKIFLRDKQINYCTGCGLCVDRKGTCSQKDDMAEVLRKMIDAEVIVMATPIYFYAMNGQLKTLIDRTCAGYTLLSNKEMFFVMTAADGSEEAMDAALAEFRGFTSCLTDPVEKGVVYGTGVWNKGEVKGTAAMARAYEMGKGV